MKAIVMAGGFGTRLRPLTINTPKPMVPIGNVPMMEHVVSLLAKAGLTDITSLLYFQPETIKQHFGDGSQFGVKMEYCIPDDDYGTAGAVKHALGKVNEPVLVISGDVIADFDLAKAIAWHQMRRAEATILLTRVENPLPFGIVITNDDGRIARFLEKPSWGEAFSDTINTGIYILQPEAVELIPEQTNYDFSADLFPRMLERSANLFGLVMDGYWKDVGNIEEYFRVHRHLYDGTVSLDLRNPGQKKGGGILYRGANVVLGDDVKFSGTVIVGDDVQIAAGTILHNSVIGDRSRVGRNCDLKDSVLWPDVTLGNGCIASGSAVGTGSRLGDHVQMLDNTIIADGCVVGSDATIKANCKIWPDKTVDEGSTVSYSLVWGEKWNRELFTDSKVSGLALTEITPEMAVRLGAAFGASLGLGAEVVTSRDGSDVSRLLRRSLISGLLAAGIHVADMEDAPVPVVRYALSQGEYAAGIYVRHNPEDNRQLDFIFFHGSGIDMPTNRLKKVERNYFGEDFQRASLEEIGHLDYPQRILQDYQGEFISAVKADLIREAGFKIVVDYGYGSASEIFPTLYSELGISATELNANPHPRKYATSPGEDAQSIVQLAAIVSSLHADVGFRINPAAEKLTVVDDLGKPLDSQTLLLLVTELFCQLNQPKKIAVPVAASMGIEEIAGRYGAEVLRVAGDHRAMMDIRRSVEVDYVGGTLGGFIFPGFQTGSDALLSSVHILEMLAQTRSRISDLRGKYTHLIRRTISVPCPWSAKGTVMRRLIAESKDKERLLIDGVRVCDDGGWVHVSPDRLRASFNIQAESTSKKVTDRILNRYQDIVEKSQSA